MISGHFAQCSVCLPFGGVWFLFLRYQRQFHDRDKNLIASHFKSRFCALHWHAYSPQAGTLLCERFILFLVFSECNLTWIYWTAYIALSILLHFAGDKVRKNLIRLKIYLTLNWHSESHCMSSNSTCFRCFVFISLCRVLSTLLPKPMDFLSFSRQILG